MIILEIKNYNTILTEKQKKNISIIISKNWYTWIFYRWKILPSDKKGEIEQSNFTYLGKAFEK